MKAFIQQAEEWKMDSAMAETKLKELETRQPARLLIASTAEVKDLSSEKVRLMKQHDARMRSLEEKGENANTAFNKYVRGHDDAIDKGRGIKYSWTG